MSSDNSREVTPSLEMKKLLNQATGQQGFQDILLRSLLPNHYVEIGIFEGYSQSSAIAQSRKELNFRS